MAYARIKTPTTSIKVQALSADDPTGSRDGFAVFVPRTDYTSALAKTDQRVAALVAAGWHFQHVSGNCAVLTHSALMRDPEALLAAAQGV